MKKIYWNYYLAMFIGLVLAIGVFTKLVFDIKIDSDWFWFLAGVGLIIESFISYGKQKKFDKKYKIVER